LLLQLGVAIVVIAVMTSLEVVEVKSAPTPATVVSMICAWLVTLRGIIVSLTVEPVLFVDAFAFGLTDTATRALAFDRVCLTYLQLHSSSSLSTCPVSNLTSDETSFVHGETSRLQSYSTLCVSLPAVLLVVVYSNLSDRWSRKYVILIGPVGSILSSAICLLVAANAHWPPMALLAASVVSGLTGGFVTLLGACLGYLTATVMKNAGCQTSSSQHRPDCHRLLRLAIAEAFMQVSRTVSASSSGKILSAVGPEMVFVIGILLNVTEALYVAIRLQNIVPVVTTPAVPVPATMTTNFDNDGDEPPMTAGGDANSENSLAPIDITSDIDERGSCNVQMSVCSCCRAIDESCFASCRQRVSAVTPCRISDITRVVCEYFRDYVTTLTRRRHDNCRLYLIVVVVFTGVESLSLQSVCLYTEHCLFYALIACHKRCMNWDNELVHLRPHAVTALHNSIDSIDIGETNRRGI
jgi:MFS family permease